MVNDVRLPSDLAERLRGRAVLSIPEAGELLGLSADGSYDLARSGGLPTIPAGTRRKVVPLGALLSMLGFDQESERTDPPGPVLPTPTPTEPITPERSGYVQDTAAL